MVGVSMCMRGTQDIKQWDYVLSNFEISPKNVWNRGRVLNYSGKFQQTIKTIAELHDVPLVVIQPREGKYLSGEVSLITFEHPENAIYIFGADHVHLTTEDLGDRIPEHLVYIPTKGEMFSWVAAAVVFYDRMLKNG